MVVTVVKFGGVSALQSTYLYTTVVLSVCQDKERGGTVDVWGTLLVCVGHC